MGMSSYVLDKEEEHFNKWMEAVDAFCIEKIGLSVHDLDDYSWAEACADGLTPEQAFNDYYEWIFDGEGDN